MRPMIGGVMIALVVFGLSGCASSGYGKQFQRLQSQIGLLDERLTQLERGTSSHPADAVWSETATSSEVASVSQGAASDIPASMGKKGSAKGWIKPSTREIQQALVNAGLYQGSVDGKKGPLTRQAVQEFQRLHGLKDDGVVGKQTWAKLSPYLEGTLSSEISNASELTALK